MQEPVHIQLYGVYAPGIVTGSITPQTDSEAASADSTFIASTTVEMTDTSASSAAADALTTATATVTSKLYDADGQVVAHATDDLPEAVYTGSPSTVTQNLSLSGASLWSVEFPSLYTLETTVTVNGAVVDRMNTTVGARKTAWLADEGFFLNDQPVKIKGCANHQVHSFPTHSLAHLRAHSLPHPFSVPHFHFHFPLLHFHFLFRTLLASV